MTWLRFVVWVLGVGCWVSVSMFCCVWPSYVSSTWQFCVTLFSFHFPLPLLVLVILAPDVATSIYPATNNVTQPSTPQTSFTLLQNSIVNGVAIDEICFACIRSYFHRCHSQLINTLFISRDEDIIIRPRLPHHILRHPCLCSSCPTILTTPNPNNTDNNTAPSSTPIEPPPNPPKHVIPYLPRLLLHPRRISFRRQIRNQIGLSQTGQTAPSRRQPQQGHHARIPRYQSSLRGIERR